MSRKWTVAIALRIRFLKQRIFEAFRIQKYKLLGCQIGKKTVLGNVFISIPEFVRIGENCLLEDFVRLRSGGAWGNAKIRIGDTTFIGHSTQINVGTSFEIGSNCLIAPLTIFTDAKHGFETRDVPMNDQNCTYSSITVADDVWIGSGCVILGGVTINKGVIVAAGSVVNKSIPAFEVWGGIPAKKIKERPT